MIEDGGAPGNGANCEARGAIGRGAGLVSGADSKD
jgi:hypothetical protein